MTVFLSWSGEESKLYAEAWKKWMSDVFSDVETFLSSKDIKAGKEWRRELGKQIRNAKVGIVFITAENMREPWILFESGALAIAKRRILVTYMVSGSPDNLPSPLSAFQWINSDKEGAGKIYQLLEDELGDPSMEFPQAWLKLQYWLRKVRLKMNELT